MFRIGEFDEDDAARLWDVTVELLHP